MRGRELDIDSENEVPDGAVAIPLTRGFVAWIDLEDIEALSPFKWCAVRRGDCVYAARGRRENNGTIYMHREIMGNPPGVQIDHKRHRFERGVVDNRKSNLRLAPGSSNRMNLRKRKDNKHTIFKGVRLLPSGKWQANITVRGNRRYLGNFQLEAYAALVYDLAAVESFGEFALTNFPVPGSTNWIYGEGVAS